MNRRILVAGIGNIFFGDDAFGVEVVRELCGALCPTPFASRISASAVTIWPTQSWTDTRRRSWSTLRRGEASGDSLFDRAGPRWNREARERRCSSHGSHERAPTGPRPWRPAGKALPRGLRARRARNRRNRLSPSVARPCLKPWR